jgi:hypothetical protein
LNPGHGELFLQYFDGALAVGLRLFELTSGTKIGLYCWFNLHVGPILVYDIFAKLMTSQNHLEPGMPGNSSYCYDKKILSLNLLENEMYDQISQERHKSITLKCGCLTSQCFYCSLSTPIRGIATQTPQDQIIVGGVQGHLQIPDPMSTHSS